jgi:virulence-associated protein VagC
LSLVKVDSQRRIYIPKELPFKADKAIIVPYGASFLLIPVPEKIIEIDVKASIQELKRRAEEKAREEVAVKMERHKQD